MGNKGTIIYNNHTTNNTQTWGLDGSSPCVMPRAPQREVPKWEFGNSHLGTSLGTIYSCKTQFSENAWTLPEVRLTYRKINIFYFYLFYLYAFILHTMCYCATWSASPKALIRLKKSKPSSPLQTHKRTCICQVKTTDSNRNPVLP